MNSNKLFRIGKYFQNNKNSTREYFRIGIPNIKNILILDIIREIENNLSKMILEKKAPTQLHHIFREVYGNPSG